MVAISSYLSFNKDLRDISGKIWTAYGGATINTTPGSPKFGPGCLDLGAVNSVKYIQTPASADTNLLDLNFGIGFWYRPVDDAQAYIAGQCDSAGTNSSWVVYVPGAGEIRFLCSLGSSTFTGTIANNIWHYLFMGRVDGSFVGLVDGVPGTTLNVGTSSISSSAYKIGLGVRGERVSAVTTPGGLYDDFFIKVGNCPYPLSGFTPPKHPYIEDDILVFEED